MSVHDPQLLSAISSLSFSAFDGQVWGCTAKGYDPTATSSSPGRWAPGSVSVLYTSLEAEGAVAEVASYLSLLSPAPRREIELHTLHITARRTIEIADANYTALDIAHDHYQKRSYQRTQEIGAAIEFLGLDALIAPSARWPCRNLIVYSSNHGFNEVVDVVKSEIVDWQAWLSENSMEQEYVGRICVDPIVR